MDYLFFVLFGEKLVENNINFIFVVIKNYYMLYKNFIVLIFGIMVEILDGDFKNII